jgi:hypothetical protein
VTRPRPAGLGNAVVMVVVMRMIVDVGMIVVMTMILLGVMRVGDVAHDLMPPSGSGADADGRPSFPQYAHECTHTAIK